MPPITNPGHIIPQDVEPGDISESFGLAEPYTQTEIEDLLYGDDRPASQRLQRLQELREQAATRESGDWGDQDPKESLGEIDRAIDELRATMGDADDGDEYAELAPTLDVSDRLDTLSPDDVDERRAIEGRDSDADFDADEPEPLDNAEWAESDGFDPDKGVH